MWGHPFAIEVSRIYVGIRRPMWLICQEACARIWELVRVWIQYDDIAIFEKLGHVCGRWVYGKWGYVY